MLRELTEREKKLAAIVGNEWLTRQEIAHLLGLPRLLPGDFEALAVLTFSGALESWKKPDNRPTGFKMVYRKPQA